VSKSKEWDCPSGCDLSEGICPHLEALLPSMNTERLSYADDARVTMDVFKTNYPLFSALDFQSLMRSYGFTEKWDLDLLTAKYVDGYSDTAIAESQAFTSRFTVKRRLKRLRDLLAERGFKPRKGSK
jgi:hypothetical protein